jgi:hypothetical protein
MMPIWLCPCAYGGTLTMLELIVTAPLTSARPVQRRPGSERDAHEREEVTEERGIRADGHGAADLPKHVACPAAVRHHQRGASTGRERAHDLEGEDRGCVALRVENELAVSAAEDESNTRRG